MTAAAATAVAECVQAVAYVAVLAAVGLHSGLPFHAGLARAAGATRDEVASAVLVGLQPAGHVVIAGLAEALRGYDAAG